MKATWLAARAVPALPGASAVPMSATGYALAAPAGMAAQTSAGVIDALRALPSGGHPFPGVCAYGRCVLLDRVNGTLVLSPPYHRMGYVHGRTTAIYAPPAPHDGAPDAWPARWEVVRGMGRASPGSGRGGLPEKSAGSPPRLVVWWSSMFKVLALLAGADAPRRRATRCAF